MDETQKQELQEEKLLNERLCQNVEKIMNNIIQNDLQIENVDLLGKLVDIHKDLANEEYWDVKKEVMKMRYREDNYGNDYGNEYGNYGRRSRDSRGRYTARGYDSKYRGNEMLNDMHESYQEYNEGREQYGRGNYRGKEESMKSLDYMMRSVVEFVEMLEQDAGSQEEVELIKKYTRKISEM